MLLVLAGLLLILVIRDIFHTVIPRSMDMRFCLAPLLVRRLLWSPFRFLASMIPSSAVRVELLSLFAPLAMFTLLILWIGLIICAFTLMSVAMGADYSPHINSVVQAVYVAASATFTVGATSDFLPRTFAVKFLMLAGALVGMLLTGSVISLMFGLIGALQPRETGVSIIENVGGSPPSGIRLLETYSADKSGQRLDAFFNYCHHWCAEIRESHIAYPILPFFRSNTAVTSWITALGAVLDATALLMSINSDENTISARLTNALGVKMLKEFEDVYELSPINSQVVEDCDFHQLYRRLHAQGYCRVSEREAKENFHALRAEYLPTHKALCKFFAVPETPLVKTVAGTEMLSEVRTRSVRVSSNSWSCIATAVSTVVERLIGC